jgi:hypothetical protein
MADYTRRELVDMAAVKLGALGAGQTLSAEDLDTIDTMVPALFDQLAEDDILAIGDEEAIPASWCPYLATLLANLVGPDFGAPFDPSIKQGSEAILRKLVRGKETYEPQTPDYF